MRSIGYATVCCVPAASQEVSQESSTAHRREYDGKSGSEMRTQSGRLDLFNSASLRLRRPLTRSTHMSLHVIHCSHVVSALFLKYMSLLYSQPSSFVDTSLNVEHLMSGAS